MNEKTCIVCGIETTHDVGKRCGEYVYMCEKCEKSFWEFMEKTYGKISVPKSNTCEIKGINPNNIKELL